MIMLFYITDLHCCKCWYNLVSLTKSADVAELTYLTFCCHVTGLSLYSGFIVMSLEFRTGLLQCLFYPFGNE